MSKLDVLKMKRFGRQPARHCYPRNCSHRGLQAISHFLFITESIYFSLLFFPFFHGPISILSSDLCFKIRTSLLETKLLSSLPPGNPSQPRTLCNSGVLLKGSIELGNLLL